MKLLRFGSPGHERPGLLIDDNGSEPMILDVRAMAYDIEDYNPFFFAINGLERLEALRQEPNRVLLPAAGIRLGTPIANPGAIICLGKNYAEHVKEFDAKLPASPILFSKTLSALNGPNDSIKIPAGCGEIDGEVELAAVIGSTACNLEPDTAMEHVAGYTVLNDVTDRAAQRNDGQWWRAKNADTFCPIGPWLVTADEAQTENCRLYSKLNGKILQDGNSSQLLFRLPEIMAFITRSITLHPGDIISTGTPAGVGSARKPPVFLKSGDTLETVVEGIGRQVCRIVN